MTYVPKTWTLTKTLERRLKAAQRNMARVMIGVSWQDHRVNEWVRRKTKVRDIMHVIKATELAWTDHIALIQDNRWTSQVTYWRPMDGSDQEVDRPRDE